MAKRTGGSGGDDTRKRSILNQVLQEASEIGLGVIAAQASSAVLRELVRGWFSGRESGEPATLSQIATLKKQAMAEAKKQSGDGKLAELYEKYLSDVIAIHASSYTDVQKDAALRQTLREYKAAVNEVKLAKSQQGLAHTLKQLSDTEAALFMRWLNIELTPEQKAAVMMVKGRINDATLLQRMLVYSNDPTQRYDYLMAALPTASITEQLGGVVQAVLTGRGGEHPLVQSFARAAKANAAERIAAVERQQNNPARKRRNRL